MREWFVRWQEVKNAQRSRVRVNQKSGGAEPASACDPACWSKWSSAVPGSGLPHMVTHSGKPALPERVFFLLKAAV